MSDTYLTIRAPSQGIYKEKGSKFLAFAFAVRTEEEIKNNIATLRKTYHDARHHCYAYILGADQLLYRANDDGEPNHSAGDPTLGQIRSRNLTDVLVVVVRYFGGTKLGISGLVQAYRTAAAEALEAAQITQKIITTPITLRFSYEQLSLIMKLLKDYEAEIITQDFQADCQLTAAVRRKYYPQLTENLLLNQVTIVSSDAYTTLDGSPQSH